MTRFALLMMRLLHGLPVPLLRAVGAALGALLYLLAPARRRVARINIAACFPDLDGAARARLVRAVFTCFAQSVVDRAVLWHGSPQRIREFVLLEGEEHLHAHLGKPLIILAPHFAGMEAGGTRMSIDHHMMTLFAHQKNPDFNRALYAGRSRFNDGVMVSRQDGMRKTLRELAKGTPFYYLPDMDLGARDAVFVPFFGIPAATVTSLSRLARITGARVLPCVTRMSPNGYVATLHPAWENYPSASLEEDTLRMNQFIEQQVRAMPAQYHWLHKRFKTRPPGEPPFYRRQA